MKITYKSWRGNVEFNSAEEAAKDALVPAAYSYDGQLEGLSARIDKLQEMLAKLIGHSKLTSKELEDVLGCGYEVEE
jgi:hypothetical protein